MSPKSLIGLAIVLVLYLLICTIPYLLEREIIFRGTPLDTSYEFDFKYDFEEYMVKMKDGCKINVLYFKNARPSKKLIFYSHGNADNLKRWGKYTEQLIDRGYNVMMFDYRGYGKSIGSPSLEKFHSDVVELFDWSQSNFSPNETVLYGRSLGAAVASHLSTQRTASQLILETPFDDLNRVMKLRFPWMIQMLKFKNNFSNILSLKQPRKFPVHIIHGDKDKIVPLKSGLKLKPLLKERDSFTIIPGGQHKNLGTFALFHSKLDELLGKKE